MPPTQTKSETKSPSKEEAPDATEAPTTEDFALVAGLCRSNASPGALRVANHFDKEVEKAQAKADKEAEKEAKKDS